MDRMSMEDRNWRHICPVHSLHPPLTCASRITSDIFLFDRFWFFFFFLFNHIAFADGGGLWALHRRHREGKCSVRGQRGTVVAVQRVSGFTEAAWRAQGPWLLPTERATTLLLPHSGSPGRRHKQQCFCNRGDTTLEERRHHRWRSYLGEKKHRNCSADAFSRQNGVT